uniref:Dilute domain-containing protein n=1 Tax=Leersia perrieri TaxID=77586 RepID=A0A0D9V2B6_9ORYZ
MSLLHGKVKKRKAVQAAKGKVARKQAGSSRCQLQARRPIIDVILSSSVLSMDGDRRRSAAITRPHGGAAPWRRLIAWLQLLLKAFAHRYGELSRWRPAFLLFVAFLAERGLRRAYLSWEESRLRPRAAAAVTVQAAFRGMAARRELSLRRRTRAAKWSFSCTDSVLPYWGKKKAQWRGRIAAWEFVAARRAAVICQCAWRRCAARRQLGKLRLARAEKERAEEMCRLREMVDVLQQAVEDAEVRVIAEREAAIKAIAEAPPVIKEIIVKVEDTEKVDSLATEVGRLKDLLGAEMKATFDAKKAVAEAELRNERLARLLGVEEVKNRQLQESLKRMEMKASDLEEENRKLREAVASVPYVRLPSNVDRDDPDLQPTSENENENENENEKAVYCEVKPMIVDRGVDIHDNNSQLYGLNDPEAEKQQQELLIKCISEDLGFSNGRPIAAYLIYRCLIHWKSFEEDRTTVFDRIIQKISAAIEARDNNETLAYWLSNSCTLLLLLQRTLKVNGAAALARQRRRASPLKTPLENQAFNHPDRPVPDGRLVGGLGEICQVEAKYPAIAFKQQLTALLEKVYGIIRHNLKKELSPLLGLCIQAPRTFVVSPRGSSQGTDLAQQASMAHWQSIIKILTNSLNILKSNYVPPFLICKLFTQVFSFINVQLFNSLLLRRECCSFSNGEYVKAGLDELEHWCHWLTEEYAGSSWDELKHIRQAVALLILEEKHKKSLKEITDDFCPALSMQQLYRISTMYCDDKYGTLGIPQDVVSSMRTKMVQQGSSSPSAQDDINSFLLDDDFSIPFSIDDIARLMINIDIADMDLPPLIQENKGSILNP